MPDDLGFDSASTATGLLERMMIHETLSPLRPGYDSSKALRAMRLIRQVIENRTRHPDRFGRRGTRPGPGAAFAIMTVKSAYLGFADAPNLKPGFMRHANDILNLARAPTDPRHRRCLAHVRLAVQAATEARPPADVIKRNLYYWLADWAGPPEGVPVFLIENVQGNNFWGQNIPE